jgi:hypothetical protein
LAGRPSFGLPWVHWYMYPPTSNLNMVSQIF